MRGDPFPWFDALATLALGAVVFLIVATLLGCLVFMCIEVWSAIV